MIRYWFALGALGLAACQAPKPIVEELAAGTPEAKIGQLATRYQELGRFSGELLVVQADSVLYHAYHGLAWYDTQQKFTDESLFELGSAGELLLLYLLQGLIREGKVNPEAPMSTYLTGLNDSRAVQVYLDRQDGLPSRQDLTQAMGITDSLSVIAYANAAATVPDLPPGDLGLLLLEQLLAQVRGRPVAELLTEMVTRLGLSYTSFAPDSRQLVRGHTAAGYEAGQAQFEQLPRRAQAKLPVCHRLVSTAADVAAFLQIYARELTLEGYQQEGGFSFGLQYEPNEQSTMVLLSNCRQPVAEEILKAVTQILQGALFELPLARERIHLTPSDLIPYVGTYRLQEQLTFEVQLQEQQLVVQLGPQVIELIPQSANQFYMPERDAAMRFLFDEDSLVSGVELLDGFVHGPIATRIQP